MPVVHSNLVFSNARIRSLQPAVDGDEPQRKAESDAGAGPAGPTGKSAYQIALDNGFVGTEVEWLATLNGVDGVDGASAYGIAVEGGFIGSETEWLASLQGPRGLQGLSFFNRRVQTIPTVVGGTATCDWGLYDEIRITLDANVTLTFTGGTDGQGCTLKLKQDATGGRTVTLPGAVRFNADITGYTTTTTASKSDRVGFIHDAGDSKFDFVSVIKGF